MMRRDLRTSVRLEDQTGTHHAQPTMRAARAENGRTAAASRLAALVMNGLLITYAPTGWARPASLARRALARVRRSLVSAFGDPLLLWVDSEIQLALPLSHDLPLYRRAFPTYARNAGDVAGLVASKYRTLAAIDVGANVGDTAAIWRSVASFPILCVEASPVYCELLRRNVGALQGVTIACAAVGAGDVTLPAALATASGTGHLAFSQEGDVAVTVRTLDSIIEASPPFDAAKLLKIDTDGFDVAVLRGAPRLLERSRPVVFFEYAPKLIHDPADVEGVFGLLAACGYRSSVAYDNVGVLVRSFELNAGRSTNDIHRYAELSPAGYCDICVFHAEDTELASTLTRLHSNTSYPGGSSK